ncbi:MAG: haloalkane dehalogenase [Acidimicrobiia bacterium]|nr:MAG: haloalkane dehalogenase [Acidimicrobiia bacterium]
MTKKYATINGLSMAYEDVGSGDPIVFLHGNPTSSYLWRNVIPHLSSSYRCIAPDLIGMGESEKLSQSGPESYRFVEHREFLDALLDSLDLGDRITLVIHDWGSGLGFDWANRHRDRVAGIAYMEAIVRPVDWESWPETARSIFMAMRSDAGESIVLEKNTFVDRILPASIIRDLSAEEMASYRQPYLEPGESRRPTLTWPRQIPIEGSPADVYDIVSSYATWMAENDLPKLFINADPGMILTGTQREFCRSWRNQTEVTVDGLHFIQEDSPDEIGTAIFAWRSGLTGA